MGFDLSFLLRLYKFGIIIAGISRRIPNRPLLHQVSRIRLEKREELLGVCRTSLPVYRQAGLLDLCGINTRYQARLNAYGIFTPMEFYNAPLELLKKQVFRSVNGYYWYLRLRGHEIEAIDFTRKSFGNTYALQQQTNDPRALARLLMKLCEKTGRRLRRASYSARGGARGMCLYGFVLVAHRAQIRRACLYDPRHLREGAAPPEHVRLHEAGP